MDQALWTHYLARELQPTLLDGMPSRDGSTPSSPVKEEEDSNDPSLISSSVPTKPETSIPTTNGKKGGSASDENSLSGPSSELEDKSNDSLLQTNNGNGNLNEDSKDFGSECIESEDSRIVPSEENSNDDNAVDNVEPAFKKQRTVGATDLTAVAVGDEAQL